MTPRLAADLLIHALDFLKMVMGQSFLQEGLTICGSKMSLKMGDLDLFFKVAGVKMCFGRMPISPFPVKWKL